MNNYQERSLPRIAFVISHPIQYYCPQYVSLAKSKKWEIKVLFASTMGRDKYYDPAYSRNISWGNLGLDKFPHEFLNAEVIPSSAKIDADNLEQHLANFDPQVVVVSGYFQKLQRRAYKWAVANRRLIYFFSDMKLPHGIRNLPRRMKAFFLIPYFSKVDRVLTTGNWNELFYHACGVPVARMTRMHLPIDRDSYQYAYERKALLRREVREMLAISDDEIIVENVGKFIDLKRQKDLVRAVGKIPESAKVRAVLLGSGPNEDALRELAENEAPGRIIFAGFVDPGDLPRYHAASDIYVHPSSFEQHSMAITEGIYCGLPVVLSDQNGSYGPHDDVRPGHNGFVYPTGDVDKLALLLERMAYDSELRENFGQASHQYAVLSQARSHGIFLEDALRADGLL